jgi:DUF1009 family protein
MNTLGLIAGSGNLPLQILKKCNEEKIKLFVVMIKGFANPIDYIEYENITITMGQIGKTMSFLKKNNVKNILFAGAVKKPNLKDIIPDIKGFFLLLRLLKNKIRGDDKILRDVISFAEENGFNIIPVNDFLNIEIKKGNINSIKFIEKYHIDIEYGIKILKQIGELDIGQSVIIQNGIVLGIECIEGTQLLIERCKKLKYVKGRKPILVKMKKINQTNKADLPSIGIDTIKQLIESGFAGIAIDSNGIIIEEKKTIDFANENNIFIYGI